VFRLFLWVGLLAPTTFAQWPRYVDGSERPHDSPPAHPLAYFTADPRSRPDCERLCRSLDLSWPSTAREAADLARTHANLRLVGKIAAFTIYDLDYFLGGNPWFGSDDVNQGRPDLRSVLVNTGPEQFREILVQRNLGGTIYPAVLLDAGQQKVLKTEYWSAGHPGSREEAYFAFSESGPQLLDFTPVYEAAAKVVPENMNMFRLAEEFDFGTLSWTIPTEWLDARTNPAHCCGGGRIKVTFRLDPGRVIPIGAAYEP